MNVLKYSLPNPAVLPRRTCRHLVITAENLAKAHRGARERAFLAAHWILGSLTITQPTVRSATRVFRVSKPTVDAAVAELKAATTAAPSMLEDVWKQATPAERTALVSKHLNEMWHVFENATAA